MPRLRTFLLALMLAAPAGGCLSAHGFAATGSQPVVLPSYAYDGAGVRTATGTLNLDLDERSNSGSIQATLHDDFHRYDVRWTNFTGRVPYQSGGVARDLELWGDSGNGSSVFPRVFTYAAAFGRASYAVDTQGERDPTSLADTFNAFFFLTRGQYRDAQTHRITNAEGTRPYDPQDPTDARINQIGAQAAILLYASNGALYRYYEFNQIQVTRRG